MSRTYKATGINLRGMPLGEADRLVTVLTAEYGLIRAVAPGARKQKSKLRGRCELFVVNQLLIVKGRSLDKIIQVETIESYPGLSKDLGKLSASQYLAELTLGLALSEQPQIELYELLTEHLRRLEALPKNAPVYAHLAQAVFHLLAIAGVGPQVQACCLTGAPLTANENDPHWRAGFSFDAGGLVDLASGSAADSPTTEHQLFSERINTKIGAVELTLLQKLGAQFLPTASQVSAPDISLDAAWVRVERVLREYTQHHFGRCFRSAALVDALSPLEF
ncbi:MAG: DNA repair protein RecO [Cyanophyceae cyanobacterium]